MNVPRLLLIGFQSPLSDDIYPPLRSFMDEVGARAELEYFHFRERGLFIQGVVAAPRDPRAYRYAARALFSSFVDTLALHRSPDAYDAVIAIDQYAYAAAAVALRQPNLVLWSLDIVARDHRLFGNPVLRVTRQLAMVGLRQHTRVIIQDRDRLGVLADSYGIDAASLDAFFMPVFLSSTEAVPGRLPDDGRLVLMQCGGIGAYRLSDRLLHHYQGHANEYQLWLHGYLVGPDIRTGLDECRVHPAVSWKTVAPAELPQLIDQCDVGFVGYGTGDLNHRHMVNCSGQMLEFLRMGKPVIVSGSASLGAFVEAQGIGAYVADVSLLGSALRRVAQDYTAYSRRALDCFKKRFSAERNVLRLIEWLDPPNHATRLR